MKVNLELTDTFQGQSNYSWVKRETLEFKEGTSDLSIMRAVKAWAGWTGLKCKVTKFDDIWDIRPYGVCQVLFVTADHED